MTGILDFKFHILIFFITLLTLTSFHFDPDLGWHLAYGERFLQNRAIIRSDSFTWTMQGYEWGNSYFLYQIIVAFLMDNIGFSITAVIFGIIAGLSIIIILPRKVDIFTVFLVILGAGFASSNLAVRPHVFDVLFFALILNLLSKGFHSTKKALFFWLLFFALWANIHVGFLVGIATLVCFVFFEKLKSKSFEKAVSWAGVHFLAIFTGTLLTPFSYRMWMSIIFDSGGTEAWLRIKEFHSIIYFFPANIFFGISGVIFIYILRSNFQRKNLSWILTISFLFCLPFVMVFFAMFWAIGFIFIASRNLKIELIKMNVWQKLAVILPVSLVIFALFINYLLGILESLDINRLLSKQGYPLRAIEYLKKEKLTEAVFNDYGWGGYLIWKAPEIKVFIDGRLAGWRKPNGDFILRDYLDILSGKCELLEEYKIKTVLIKKSVKKNNCFGNFKKVYADEIAEVWTRKQ